jgi:hypothetical protein
VTKRNTASASGSSCWVTWCSRCGRGNQTVDRLWPCTRHHVRDDAPAVRSLLARRLHLRQRRPRVGLERLADRLAVDQLRIEASGAERGDEIAHEVGHRLVAEHELEQLALETARDAAPVAPHRFEPDDLESVVHQPGVALLAPVLPEGETGVNVGGWGVLSTFAGKSPYERYLASCETLSSQWSHRPSSRRRRCS